MRKISLFVFVVFISSFLVYFSFPFFRIVLLDLGIVKEEINIAGTGSMFPTFPKLDTGDDIVNARQIVAWPKMRRYPGGLKLFGLNFFTYKIKRGDIVEIENETTRLLSQKKYGIEAGFVKRVVAVSGDTVELRDGFLYLNGSFLDEPYTAKPRSTYGGDFLPDCKQLKIPENKVFVLGDNRKASLDSRHELSLVDLSHIHYVLPLEEQEEYKSRWRDTRQDSLLARTSTLNETEFIRLLNSKRIKENLKAYQKSPLLSNSAKIRGQAIVEIDDFSIEATRSGVTLEMAVKKVGYKNIVFAELFTRGFYEAEELLDNFLEFPNTKNILYSKDYQDIGLATYYGEINNCPIQVVVAHFGGYKPPNYSKELIDNWDKLVNNLKEVMPSWQSLREADGVDKNKVKRLLELFDIRLVNGEKILSKLKANQWLTEEEKKLFEEDKNIAAEMERLMDELTKK